MKLNFFRRYSAPALILTVFWLLLVDNAAYWRTVVEQSANHGPWFLVSFGLFSFAALTLILSLLTFGRLTRYVLVTLLLIASIAAYFMDAMGIMIDRAMIENVVQTDRVEALELVNPGLALRVVLAGVLPAVAIWFLAPKRQAFGRMLREKAAVLGLSLVALVIAVAPFYKDYASLFRNHREIHYLLNPVNSINGVYGYVSDLGQTPRIITQVATDAHKGAIWRSVERPVVSVIVIGETARAASFSLYGYERDTNPSLAAHDLIRFNEVSACGTSTAVSLPCMFSDLGRDDFDRSEVRARESLLDVVQRAGIRTVWLENNSGCKGLCRGAEVWSSEGLDIDGVCADGECLDSVLLDRLDDELQSPAEPTMIVIHMNGSHGPSYYRRYPEDFRIFAPDCRSDDLSDCSQEEIRNSYDNTIRYTDWFLGEVIDRLAQAAASVDTSLLYVSDHGESLGEFGMFLHGTPYFLAPEEQTRVPMFLWLSSGYADEFGIDRECLEQRRAQPVSHDYLFHSILGMLDIETRDHRQGLDFFAGCTVTPLASHQVAGIEPTPTAGGPAGHTP
jgi:lipid A ethanolaminephosphotransferase